MSNIQVDALAPMSGPVDSVQLNIRSLHATMALIQEALYRIEKQIKELTP